MIRPSKAYPLGVQYARRSSVENMIDHMRRDCADTRTSHELRNYLEFVLRRLRFDVDGDVVLPLEPCNGAAHSADVSDYSACDECHPRWGFTGTFIKVR